LYIWIPLIVLLMAMWTVFEGMSYSYELRAYALVDEKRQRELKPSGIPAVSANAQESVDADASGATRSG